MAANASNQEIEAQFQRMLAERQQVLQLMYCCSNCFGDLVIPYLIVMFSDVGQAQWSWRRFARTRASYRMPVKVQERPKMLAYDWGSIGWTYSGGCIASYWRKQKPGLWLIALMMGCLNFCQFWTWPVFPEWVSSNGVFVDCPAGHHVKASVGWQDEEDRWL